MPTHIIRLRGPWECEPIEGESQARMRFTRRFGLPTNLTARDRVWLVIDRAKCRGAVSLNKEPLGAIAGDFRIADFDITNRLLPRNVLRIDLEIPHNENASVQRDLSPFGEVYLEIRSKASD